MNVKVGRGPSVVRTNSRRPVETIASFANQGRASPASTTVRQALAGSCAASTVLRFAELDARKRSFNRPRTRHDVLGRAEGSKATGGDQMASWPNAFLAQRRKGATQT